MQVRILPMCQNKNGSAATMVVLCRTVNPVPQGKQWWFESTRSHLFPSDKRGFEESLRSERKNGHFLAKRISRRYKHRSSREAP